MFKQLYDLAQKAGPIQMTLAAGGEDGRMTVVVTPKGGAAKDEPALATPLSLTATPEEFDEGFVQVLTSYSETRLSLAEQVAATNEVLAAAREASVKKGTGAVQKAGAKSTTKTPPATASEGRDGDPDDDTGGEEEGTTVTASSAAAQLPVAASAPNLFG
jgi:PRTRC genetic system protein E